MRKYPQSTFFLIYIEKKSTHPVPGAWSLLQVHNQLTPSKGPKAIKNASFFL